MKADRRQSLARAAAVAVTGAVLALASAPAASATTDSKPQPRSTASTSTTTTSKTSGRGHKTTAHHGAGTPRGGKPGSTSTPLSPRTATAPGTTAPAVAPAANPSWTEPAAPGAAAPAAAHPATNGATPTPAATHDSTWQRDSDTGHADRGVVRAFASDLKKAGQSAGFPAFLVAVMVVFLLVQHRLDRRDAKLSHADWVSDQGLEFSAPATMTQH